MYRPGAEDNALLTSEQSLTHNHGNPLERAAMSESSPSEKTATGLPDSVLDRYVRVGNIRTHYLEAGNSGPTVVLLHSAEYGARASFSWFANIEFLAQDFRVVAPDMVGFGYTDKLHSFTDQWMLRVQHIRDFLETLCIEDAHFVGSSYAGGLIQRVGLMEPALWPIRSITSIGGGGAFPDSPARRKLFGYDGTLESYRDMMRVLCDDPCWHADDVVMERWQASIEPGAWEALSAPRLAMPGAQAPPPPPQPTMQDLRIPTLIVAGDRDELRTPEAQRALASEIPNAEFHLLSPAKHNPHYECPDAFNQIAREFLLKHS